MGGVGVARASRKLVSPTLLLLCSEWSRRGPVVLESSQDVARRELRLLASALQDASPYGSGLGPRGPVNDTFPQQ